MFNMPGPEMLYSLMTRVRQVVVIQLITILGNRQYLNHPGDLLNPERFVADDGNYMFNEEFANIVHHGPDRGQFQI